MTDRGFRVVVIGAGKVGRALTGALRRGGWSVRLVPARSVGRRRRLDAALVVLAVRDSHLGDLAADLAARRVVSPRAAVVHVAGALGTEALAPLRGRVAGVGQLHPMLSFASAARPPVLEGGHALVAGDAPAVERASRVARAVGLRARRWRRLERGLYHAAGGLLANGAATLAAAAAELLVAAGAPRHQAPAVLGPLLASVARNVETLGLPVALTGPVRRGDAGTVERHLAMVAGAVPGALDLYVACCLAQIPLARSLGEADSRSLARIAQVAARARRRQASSAAQRVGIPRPGRRA